MLLLASLGSELRRPLADLLQDGIYELRIRVGRVNYRILYFFCGSNIACLSHGLTKEGVVSTSDIETAIERKKLVLSSLDRYTAEWEI
jgi:putative component of toxin-antitoxin plasmid stabilization module